ncbi:tyrosine-type recombinase/integrase [Methylobacterium oxalidis]|uniref:tyrosine-type recombinase/integrase n=1 Tax=Methylobacterium oxalidis TaxID=944322 RepID=UPI003314B4C3
MSTLVPVKNVKRYRDRHGKWRCYHRPTGRPILSEFGSEEFFAELRALNGAVEAKPKAARGTLKAVMDEYKRSLAFADLAMASRAQYEKYFQVAKPLHDVPIRAIDAAALAVMRDKIALKRGRRTANLTLAVISILFGFAIERKHATVNPAMAVKRAKRDKTKPAANRPWTLEERRAVLEAAPIHIRVPVALCMFTGMRKRDALTVTKAAIQGSRIETSKTGEEVFVLIHPDLAAILASVPEHKAPTIAATTRGQPWTSTGFDSVWDRFKRGLEAEGKVGPGLTLHGLRHTVGGLLAQAGCDLDTIRRVLGQRTLQMAQLYSERAKKEAATQEALGRLDPLQNGRKQGEKKTAVSNLGKDSV